jgi:hypothetical protein
MRVSGRMAVVCRLGLLAAGAATLGVHMPVQAGSFEFWDIEGSYKATLGYSAAWRMEDPDPALIDGAVIPLEPVLFPPGQIAGFINSGLPRTINGDDGNRNFEKGDMVNNRLSLFTELQFRRDNYGLVVSGDIFRDEAYLDRNANDSPETLNRSDAAMRFDRFSNAAERYSGQRARLLEAYAYGDWSLFDGRMYLNLRVGEHVVGWGEK